MQRKKKNYQLYHFSSLVVARSHFDGTSVFFFFIFFFAIALCLVLHWYARFSHVNSFYHVIMVEFWLRFKRDIIVDYYFVHVLAFAFYIHFTRLFCCFFLHFHCCVCNENWLTSQVKIVIAIVVTLSSIFDGTMHKITVYNKMLHKWMKIGKWFLYVVNGFGFKQLVITAVLRPVLY